MFKVAAITIILYSILKILGFLSLSWFWVFSPLLIPILGILFIFLMISLSFTIFIVGVFLFEMLVKKL